MCRQIARSFVPGFVAAALFAWGCDRPANPAGTKPSYWFVGGGCNAGDKFTGGGRIDPAAGKTTFGFNVDAQDFCANGGAIKGELQTVYHPNQTLVHSLSYTSFESHFVPGGRCAQWTGTARVKVGNGSWTEPHDFQVIACDRGEPGSSPGRGPDSYGISVDGVGTIPETPLTGGNIQAH